MRACMEHWTALRAAIEAKGMSGLVAPDGMAATERIVAEIEGRATAATFDPLMSAMNMILGQALQSGGLYLLTQKEDGSEYCPLCEAEAHGGLGAAANWIAGSTDAALAYCREHGLLPVPS